MLPISDSVISGRFLSIAAFAGILLLAGCRPPRLPQVSRRLTSEAQILAGIEPAGKDHERFTASDAWKAHTAFLEPRWAEVKRTFVDPAMKWQDRAIGYKAHAPQVLLYPFDGVNFLNAYLFFPYGDTFVLLGTAPPGKAPDIGSLPEMEFADLLAKVRGEFSAVLEGGTKTTDAALILLVFMALSDMRIVGVEHVVIANDGSVVPLPAGGPPSSRIPGIRIGFVNPKLGKPQSLTYFQVEPSDSTLEHRPELTRFIERLEGTNTFMRSSGYRLHSSRWEKFRELLLSVTNVLLQDDSGVPYGEMKDWWEWVKLYGKYTGTTGDGGIGKDIDKAFQEDLERVYRVQSPSPLPFVFPSGGSTNLMLVVKDFDNAKQRLRNKEK